MEYLHLFNTDAEFQDAYINNYHKPWVSYTKETDTINYNKNDPSNGHEYIEIGGLKWATMNVGATSETDYGLYFQWGDTQGYTADQVGSGEGQKYFGWADYKYGNSTSSGITKYNSMDDKTVLDLSDDPARAVYGGSWRLPTRAEFTALGNAVNSVFTRNYNGSGVRGLVCTDKTDSSKVLFFPAAGFCYDGRFTFARDYGFYWSSSLFSSDIQNAAYLAFTTYGDVSWQTDNFRYYGCSVRGVLDI